MGESAPGSVAGRFGFGLGRGGMNGDGCEGHGLNLRPQDAGVPIVGRIGAKLRRENASQPVKVTVIAAQEVSGGARPGGQRSRRPKSEAQSRGRRPRGAPQAGHGRGPTIGVGAGWGGGGGARSGRSRTTTRAMGRSFRTAEPEYRP